MSQLDNPIWHALTTRHARLATVHGQAARYPADVTPFVAIPTASSEAALDLGAITYPGERVGILAVIPPLGQGWRLVDEIEICQYLWPTDLEACADPEVRLLNESDQQAMLDLTAMVYPAYFRRGTAKLGSYFGIVRDGQLCSMAGVRMAMDGFQEISAICTHPDHRGKGDATRLTRHVAHHIREAGDTPFLHTESVNAPARGMYGKLGFELRATMPFHVYDRF